MIINDIIEYFRSIANRHQDVMGFRTGDKYEHNEGANDYPLVWLYTDFVTRYNSEDGLLSATTALVTFRLSVTELSKEAYDSERVYNQIKWQNKRTAQDTSLDKCYTILTQLVQKAVLDINEDYLLRASIRDAAGTSMKRMYNEDCEGWYVELTMRVDLDCLDEEIFGEDVIDTGYSKTSYQLPENNNPIN